MATVVCAVAHAADTLTPAELEFFESKVRPVFAKNCYGCHSSQLKAPMGGLYLDSPNSMRMGGKSGPAIVPGDPEASLLIHAIRYDGRKMPPSGKLSNSDIANLEKWVVMGAPDPRQGPKKVSSSIDVEKGRRYWAFQPPLKSVPPDVRNSDWSSQPIDRFVLARMEKEHLTPVADAGRLAWIRRITLDLTGLPPTIQEIDSFLAEPSNDAYGKVADRLLASPRFGERWGRHWLDVARYADTQGHGRNHVFSFAWRYRDWVIDAFNSDMPYDRFVREQVAGDLLPSTSVQQANDQLIATGFLAVGSMDLVEQNPIQFTMDTVDEQINATSHAFMGITVGCARCHDHKFDPISMGDYYAMAGIFKSTEKLSGLRHRGAADYNGYVIQSLLARLSHPPDEKTPAFLPDPKDRAEYDRLQTELVELNRNPRGVMVKLGLTPPPAGKELSPDETQKVRQEANRIIGELDRFPLPSDLAVAVRDDSNPADCEIYLHGESKDLGPQVPRGFPQVMSKPGETSRIGSKESGRLQLAEWLTHPDNPTTARVAVNRIWQHLFGRGIVASADNFGRMGSSPSNQALLDYLAVRFVEQGWSTKKLIRELVLTRTYRLSSELSAANINIDPDNVFLWRANRQRLEVEAIRDSVLMIAGQLDLNRPAGSPVMDLPRSVPVGRGDMPPDYAEIMHNRSVYVPVLRNFLPSVYEAFDFPEPSETKGVRDVTTVPTQALFLMNSPFVIDQARHAASRLLAANLSSPQQRVTRVYREVLGRSPTESEVTRAMVFLHTEQEHAQSEPSPEVSAWEHFYQALFASAEFRYRS
jgi:hypothetical protein